MHLGGDSSLPDLKAKVLVLDEDQLALELYSRELGSDYQVITSESVGETRQALKTSTRYPCHDPRLMKMKAGLEDIQ
jgi:response regulator RpfG family c-di-GMP phosphodiesterase